MTDEPLPEWKRAWQAFAKRMSTKGLEALRDALRDDDPRLIQGATTVPPTFSYTLDWPLYAACPVATAYAADLGGLALAPGEFDLPRGGSRPYDLDSPQAHPPTNTACATVGAVEDAFAQACYAADVELGELAGCRWLLHAVDDWDRPALIANLLPEVEFALAQRNEL